MSKKVWLGVGASVSLAGAALFHYFSDMAIKRKAPKIPGRIQKGIDREQQDDLFHGKNDPAAAALKALPREDVTIQSNDGLTLYGRIFVPEQPKRVILLMHGWRSSWRKDYGVLVKGLLARDCILCFPDERAHGKSEGKYITYGFREKEDCVLWANFLAQRYPDFPLYLWGMSMGATTVMLASGQKGLPKQLCGIVADCGFTCAKEEFQHLIRQKLPGTEKFLTELYRRRFLHRCGFDIAGENTAEALKRNPYPILFFHGNNDVFVPTEMTKRNYAAAIAEKEMVLIDGAAHCKSFHVDPDTCFAKAEDFFARCEEPA